MPDRFQFTCPKCKKKLRGSTSLRGKQVRCPGCQAKLKIPAAALPPLAHPSPVAPEPAASGSPGVTSRQAESPQPSAAMGRAAQASSSAPTSLDDFGLGDLHSHAGTAIGSADALEENLFDMEIPPAVDLQNVPAPSPFFQSSAASPLAATNLAPKPKVDLCDAIEKQISGKISKGGVSLGYRFGLFVTSVFMLTLPLAYLTMIGLFGYGVYYYTTNVVPVLTDSPIRGGRAMIFIFLLAVTPIIMGITAIIFMIKPVFVSVISAGGVRQRSLRRENEPKLFALVDRICEVTGAPRPTRIDVDSDVNASASFRSGFRSLFTSDLVLTIGVPLVAGLNTRQFAGVLAHEFGHFSQGASMRASFLIRGINFWFAKMVYQRDAVDEMLDEAVEDSETAFGLVLMAAQLCVFLTRRVVWVFMMVGHVGSCFLMRQMEYDADRYEIYLAGSRNFASTTHALERLGVAYQATLFGLGRLINRAVLIDNVPRMTVLLRNQMNEKQVARIRQGIEAGRTGLFDTHPCARARIAAAERIETEGMFTLEAPARELFANFDGLCRNVTQDFYRNAIGRLVDPNELQPVERHIHDLIG